MTSNSEPPYLSIGTAVSAKYRGAFCEAIVKKIEKSMKCRVFLKETQSNLLVTDEYITGPLEVGATVEVKHPDTERVMEATIKQLSDSSMYTVVFDDNDERTLRRTQLCLKGDKHFVESETLDNHPLSNPEHFGTPVIVRGKRSRSSNGTCSNQGDSGSSSEEDEVEDESPRKTYRGKTQELVGKLMFYESDDRKKSAILPVLVVLPDANSIELKTKDHLLVRSFKDNKFFSVAKKDLLPFSREAALKNEEKSLKPAMEKALLFVDNRELPQSWNKEELLGVDEGQQEAEVESDDEEQTEDKDRFVAQLYKFSDDRGTPINKGPSIGSKDLNLYKLFKIVHKLGGYNRVTNQMRWRLVYSKMLLPPSNTASTQIKNAYKKYLHAFEDFYRKLGSSMGTVSRPSRNRNDTGRSLVAFRSRDLAKTLEKGESIKEKIPENTKSEFENNAKSMLPKEVTPKKTKSTRVKAEFIKGLSAEKPDVKSAAAEIKKEEIRKDIKAVDDKKDMKNVEKSPKKALVRKIRDDKKEVKSAQEIKEVNHDGDKVEKRVLKKKEDGSVKEKKETQEKFKDLQRKRRRSAVKLDVDVDSKTEKIENVKDKKEEFKVEKVEIRNEMEERQKEEIRKDKTELKIEEVLKEEEITDTKEEVIEKVEEHCGDKDNLKEAQDDKIEKNAKKKKEKLNETGDKDPHLVANIQSSEDLPVGAKLRVQCGKGKNASQYEAKILEVGVDPGPRRYLVHYKGWNNRHDEWIKTDRILYILAKPSDGKKKYHWRSFPKPGIKVFKKKASFDKPPSSPSSVKSDSSAGQGLGQHGDNSNKSSPAASTCYLRSTRSHSIELITDGPLGSENEDSDKSDDDSELDKTLDKSDEMEFSQKSCSMLLDESEKQKEEASDIDSSIGLVSLNLLDNTEKDKTENNEVTVNKEENGEKVEVKEDTVDHFCMKQDKDKFCEPILEKVETNVNFSLVKLESSFDIEVEKVLYPEKKDEKKEALTHEENLFLKIDELEVNTECVKKVEKINEDKKTVREDDQKLEESPYDFKDESKVETAVKIQEKKKAAVPENKEDFEKEVKQEPVTDVPTVVGDSKNDLGKDLLTKLSLNNDNEVAKSGSEVENKGKEKRMSYSEIDIIEYKKARVVTIENVLCHVGNALSVSPERKPFVKLAQKKQICSPIVRKLIPAPPEKCVEIQYGKFESIPEESGNEKNESKEGLQVMDMVVVHKIAPVKKDIVIEKKVDVYNEDNGSTLKNENGEDNENNEVTSVASVRRKIRKKTKKKLEMEEIEAVTAVRKIAKRGLGTRKTKDIRNKEITESAITVDAMEIDLHCEEQIQLHSASPEHVSSSQSFIQELQGFVPRIETIDCRISDSQGSDSFISKHNNSTISQSSVNKSNVFENTPPTTPEHDSDDVSHPKSQTNPIKINIKTFGGGSSKIENSQPASSEPPDGNASPSNHSTGSSSSIVAGSEGSDHVPVFSVKRRQRDSDDSSPTKRRKISSRVKSSSCRIRQFGESDSEDTNVSLKSRSPHYSSDSYPRSVTNIRSFRPPKYNFNLEDGKLLEGTAKISFLVQKITEIRKLYMNLKSEVACIDRRRKKLKRKDKERETQNSSTLQVECS